MKKPFFLLTALLWIYPDVSRADETESLDALVARISDVCDREAGLSKMEQDYIKKLLKHEKEAIPRLVGLLAHKDPDVAEMAAAALGDCTSIDPKYLPQIIAGLDRNIGWLPRALARIESDLAAKEAVSRFLVSSSAPHNQEAYAVEVQGVRALPFIMEAVKNDGGRNPQIYSLFGHVLKEMKAEARKKAATLLLAPLKDKQSSSDLLRGVLVMIAHLDQDGQVLEDELLRMIESRPELRKEIQSALIGIKSTHSGKIFAAMLKEKPDMLLFRDIAQAGDCAKDAGPELAKLLQHADGRLRLAAARTIGFIGYQDASARLLELMDDPFDVRIHVVAAESLGRLKSREALMGLKQAAEKHWHPSVRNAARIAVEKIESQADYKLKYHKDYEDLGLDVPEYFHIPEVLDPSDLRAHEAKNPGLSEKLAYASETVTIEAADEKEQIAQKGENAVIEVHPGNAVERRHKIPVTPRVGLRVENGWLLGDSRGEWGGEIVFKGDQSEPYEIIGENVSGIYRIGERIVAVTGLAHISTNRGLVYELKIIDGKWQATPWRALPGAPMSSGKLKSGELMVATMRGGVIILAENGQMRMGDATPSEAKTK